MDREYTAEDEEMIRNSLKRNIEACGLGFKVIAMAEDGSKLLDFVSIHVPHIIFTDIQMPVIDGIELIQRLEAFHPEILKVVISGYDNFEYAREAFRGHVRDYLLKPVVKDDIKGLLVKIKSEIDEDLLKMNEELRSHDEINYTIEEIIYIIDEYLKKNYMKYFNLESYLSDFPYNQDYISRSFAKYKGYSPSKYLTLLRINKAKQILSNNMLIHVKDIAILTGYENQAYFCRIFKTITGMRPTEYRALASKGIL